ncbi:DUF6684 family protein [Natronosalvus rutilus]|uniref:Uncharacterized protein n=1 Tax=Natronosalvus rutilus TaxID=2953753 RepID=A0A9E7SUW1_9EURY|nr:DUF6684 family protein [Natronosalvus rutilus]UTF52391.1 hypothetical protein NGM29_11380 [Natronosalvus rutilus]
MTKQAMAVLGLSRESIRDISGNLVPLGVLLFFAGWLLLERPWGWDAFSLIVVYGLILSLVAILFLVTYVAAVRFQETATER